MLSSFFLFGTLSYSPVFFRVFVSCFVFFCLESFFSFLLSCVVFTCFVSSSFATRVFLISLVLCRLLLPYFLFFCHKDISHFSCLVSSSLALFRLLCFIVWCPCLCFIVWCPCLCFIVWCPCLCFIVWCPCLCFIVWCPCLLALFPPLLHCVVLLSLPFSLLCPAWALCYMLGYVCYMLGYFSAFRNPSNPEMDCTIFNMRMPEHTFRQLSTSDVFLLPQCPLVWWVFYYCFLFRDLLKNISSQRVWRSCSFGGRCGKEVSPFSSRILSDLVSWSVCRVLSDLVSWSVCRVLSDFVS